ncbi:MAG: tetratricopeptide repeat protein, partial [Planctomycetota bacterium]
MRKYLLHLLIIPFVFFLTPAIQAASDVGEEIEALKQAIRIEPEYTQAHFNLGVVYDFLNDRASA